METISTGDQKAPMPSVRKIVIAYPFILAIIAVFINSVFLDVGPIKVELPTISSLAAASIAAAILVINHSWIMTKTELTRIDYGIATATEDVSETRVLVDQAGRDAKIALGRAHRTHQNATENTVYFSLLAPLLLLSSPSELPIWLWFLGFSLGRLGHSVGYLTAHTALRGFAMSVSLVSLYGMASYLLISAVL